MQNEKADNRHHGMKKGARVKQQMRASPSGKAQVIRPNPAKSDHRIFKKHWRTATMNLVMSDLWQATSGKRIKNSGAKGAKKPMNSTESK